MALARSGDGFENLCVYPAIPHKELYLGSD